jgi:hypothetical protein
MSFHPLFGSSKNGPELLKSRSSRCVAPDPASPYVSRGIEPARSGRLGGVSPKGERIFWGRSGLWFITGTQSDLVIIGRPSRTGPVNEGSLESTSEGSAIHLGEGILVLNAVAPDIPA